MTRPITRGDCAAVPRPCPWTGCRYHQPGAVGDCALDQADARPDGMTLEEVGELLGITRERARQIEAAALVKLHARGVAVGVLDEDDRPVRSAASASRREDGCEVDEGDEDAADATWSGEDAGPRISPMVRRRRPSCVQVDGIQTVDGPQADNSDDAAATARAFPAHCNAPEGASTAADYRRSITFASTPGRRPPSSSRATSAIRLINFQVDPVDLDATRLQDRNAEPAESTAIQGLAPSPDLHAASAQRRRRIVDGNSERRGSAPRKELKP